MRKQTIYLNGVILSLLALMMVGCSSEEPANTTTNAEEQSEETNISEPQTGGEAIFSYTADVSNYDPIKGNSGGGSWFFVASL